MPSTFKTEGMAVNSKDIETLWKQYSEEGVNDGIVDCVVAGFPAGMIRGSECAKQESAIPEKRSDVYVSYVNIGLSNGIKVEHYRL